MHIQQHTSNFQIRKAYLGLNCIAYCVGVLVNLRFTALGYFDPRALCCMSLDKIIERSTKLMVTYARECDPE